MAPKDSIKKFRDGDVELTYRPTFTDNGKHYASLYAGDRLIAADVLLGDAEALCSFFHKGRARTHQYRDLAARIRDIHSARKAV